MNRDPQALLRWSLRGNATFSLLTGLCFSLSSARIAGFIGVSDPGLVLSVGINLLGFAALLLYASSREVIHLRVAMTFVWLDLGWVVGTIPLLAMGLLNSAGSWCAAAVADVVLIFAGLQYLGIRRARALLNPNRAAATIGG